MEYNDIPYLPRKQPKTFIIASNFQRTVTTPYLSLKNTRPIYCKYFKLTEN